VLKLKGVKQMGVKQGLGVTVIKVIKVIVTLVTL
jgi:hypothetical protein